MKCILFGTMAAIVVSASAKTVVWYDMSNDAADGMITAETTFTNIASPSNEFYGKIGYGARPSYGSYTEYLPVATASFEDQKAEAIKELAEMFSVSTAVATQVADAGYLNVEGIAEEDEASFIAATGLDEVTAKGIYAAAKAVAELTAGGGEE